jgi:hypothetical protein
MNTFNNPVKNKEVQCERLSSQVNHFIIFFKKTVIFLKNKETSASIADMYDSERDQSIVGKSTHEAQTVDDGIVHIGLL